MRLEQTGSGPPQPHQAPGEGVGQYRVLPQGAPPFRHHETAYNHLSLTGRLAAPGHRRAVARLTDVARRPPDVSLPVVQPLGMLLP